MEPWPDSRQVCGAMIGINTGLSEIVSDILENVARFLKVGNNSSSAEDMITRMEDCGLKLQNDATKLNSLVEVIVKGALALVVVIRNKKLIIVIGKIELILY